MNIDLLRLEIAQAAFDAIRSVIPEHQRTAAKRRIYGAVGKALTDPAHASDSGEIGVFARRQSAAGAQIALEDLQNRLRNEEPAMETVQDFISRFYSKEKQAISDGEALKRTARLEADLWLGRDEGPG